MVHNTINTQAYQRNFVCSECGPCVDLIFREHAPDGCPRCEGPTILAQTIKPFGEREWLSCTEWECMATLMDCCYSPGVGNKQGAHRRFRLFAATCCRYVWGHFTDELFRQAVEVAEAFADGLATEQDRKQAWGNAHSVGWNTGATGVHWAAINTVGDQPFAIYFPHYVLDLSDNESASTLIAHWLLDIFGNPYRPMSLEPSWLTSTVVALAEGIYQERAFDRMPILADALMDAGCDSEDVLNHCRGSGPHVRGCWVVDLLTGRT